MISCAAIQKLERYGQLGRGRHTVQYFVRLSLRDPRRCNVYALTDAPTWRSCLEALTDSGAQAGTKRRIEHNNFDDNGGDNDNGGQCDCEGGREATTAGSVVVVSDSLLLAIGHAAAFVAHHLDEQRVTGRPSGEEEEKDGQRRRYEKGESDPLEGKVFISRFEEAAELLRLLQEVAEACGRHMSYRNDGSSVVTQALAYLLSVSLDVALIAAVLRHSCNKGAETEEKLLHELCRRSTALVIAVATQLRIAQARQPLQTLYDVRPCPTLLYQFFQRTKGNVSDVTMATGTTKAAKRGGALNSEEQDNNDAIATKRIAEWTADTPRGGLLSLFASFTLFQKLSLIDALVAESPMSCCSMEIASYRRSLALVLSSAACNRATRAVVYFRGDDIKLLQHNVRESTEYALHTHATTAPAEEAMLRSLAQLPVSYQQHCALLITQWMASISLFFRSFCAEQSWTAFAQEQRRMVVLQESRARRERREQRRRKGPGGNSSAADGTGRSHSVESGSVPSDDNVSLVNEHEDIGEDCSLLSQHSAISLASRTSMISTMSKSSRTSYRTFLSVIDAARENNAGEQSDDKLYVHQSEDGNTNLPLILLEEVILALQRFMGASNDEAVNAMLDNFGLRALAWRTIGELYAFIQSTIRTVPSSMVSKGNLSDSTAETIPVFHFGHDVRYNKGLGYEVLGLLFAKVVLPQLQAARGGGGTAPRCVEQALTRCLSAYDVIAPQVIDQNLPAILRVAAHVVGTAPVQQDGDKERPVTINNDALGSDCTILHELLISLLTRLGKSNQMSMLLDSIVSHVKKEGGAFQEMEMRDADEDATAAGLHEIFSHPRVRLALLKACNMSLDPEELLARLLTYVSRWAVEDDHDEEKSDDSVSNGNKNISKSLATELSQLLPQEAIFLLDIMATVMEGILPTSITSSTLLERAAELELTLSTFLVNRLHKTFFSEVERDEQEAQGQERDNLGAAVSRHLFFGGDAVRPKMQRRLMLYTLHTIYQSRELIFSCLQDLGLHDVKAYLQMLEETMWQVQTRVGALVGSLTIDDLDATMSLSTHMKHAPYVHRATLLPQFALQRLTLARSVSVALNVEVGPTAEARRLVAFVLSYMRSATDAECVSDGDAARALELADRVTEEEWRCIVQFGRPKRVRQALVGLLQRSFAASPTTWRSPSWLARCLTCCAGFLLEALCEVIMSVTDDEVLACCQGVEGGEEKKQGMLIQLSVALGDVLRRLGHIPQWPLLLQRAVHWLLLLDQARNGSAVVKKNSVKEKFGTAKLCLLEHRLLQLIMDFLSCESGVSSLFRRVLSRPEGTHSLWRAQRKSGREREEVNEAFVDAIGVSSILSTVSLHAVVGSPAHNTHAHVENGEVDSDDAPEDGANDHEAVTKQTTAVCRILVQRIFTKEFAALLVRQCGISETATCAAGILSHLYRTALSVCRGEVTVSESPSPAHVFALTVAETMHHRCCNEADFSGLSAFLSAMSGNPVAFVTAAHGPNAEEAPHKRYRQESKELPHSSEATTTNEMNKDDIKKNVKGDKKEIDEKRQLHAVSARWVELLGVLFLKAVHCLLTELDENLLRMFTALFISLERVHVSTTPTTTTTTTTTFSAGMKKHHSSQAPGRSVNSLASVAVTVPHISSAATELSQLFAPEDKRARRRSLSTLVRLLQSENEWVIRAMWFLFVVHEGLQHHVLGDRGNDANSHSSGCWLAAVIKNFVPRHDYSASSEAMKTLLGEAETDAAAQRTHRGLTLTALRKQREEQGEEEEEEEMATRWLLGQLGVMPSILHVFAIDAVPALLQQYMHALLHEAVPFSLSSPRGSVVSSQSCKRNERLLRAACKSLRELSLVPHMRFSTWRGDVKRLLVASGTNALLSIGAKELWCDVLELVSLPLQTLHEDESFIDHELNFIQALLCEASGVFRKEEEMLLRMLRLFTRTLLPLGVLWRRAHLLPTLLSALLTRCLGGVSRGHCGRVVLNQLSSFFFQLVKDANYGSNNNNNNNYNNYNNNSSNNHNSSAPTASSSSKLLCLASVTSSLFRQSVHYVDVFTTHSSDLDFFAADLLRALQRVHLPHRNAPSALRPPPPQRGRVLSDATLCDLSYACAGHDDARCLLRQAAERMEEEEGADRRIFMVPT